MDSLAPSAGTLPSPYLNCTEEVVWGKADGVFITDIVSPLNLTDFDKIRSGVYAKIKYNF